MAKEIKQSTLLSRQGKLIRKFAEYLKNPKLKQGHATLRELDDKGSKKKCCLGHLCDFYRLETGEGKWLKRKISGATEVGWVFDAGGYTDTKLPPYPVYHFFGIDQNPYLSKYDSETQAHQKTESAAEWNDTQHATLSEIAEMFDALGKQKLEEAKADREAEKSR